MSNFRLWLDSYIVEKGQAFTNFATNLYHIGSLYNGYTAYSSPYKPFFWSTGVAGTNWSSGVWVNGSHLVVGQSGFRGINFQNGEVYFDMPVTGTVSGRFTLPELTVSLTSDPEETVLFETKYELRPKIGQTVTGLQSNEKTYPAVYLKKSASFNTPFSFGGEEETDLTVTAYIFADSQFQLDAVTSILRDSCRRYVPLLTVAEMPFNAFGGLKSGTYNYNAVISGISTVDSVYISNVRELSLTRNLYSEVKKLNPNVFLGLVDINLCKTRYPRA